MKKAQILAQQEFELFNGNSFCDLDNAILPVERKANSFGWLDNKIVVTDYE